jgi:ABC-2 type transport system ATP-binding protein
MDNQPIISVKNLQKSFGKLKVLEGINLSINSGALLALLGPNGAGKTTIIRILSTLLKPDDGEAIVDGRNVVDDPYFVRSRIGLTGQYAAVDEYLTGWENLEMMGRLYHLSREDSVKRSEELLRQFDLTDAGKRIVKTYSGGMRRRLDLAASLVATPPIIFLDEPTTGLDPRSRLAMWDIIRNLKSNGATILLTTQYLDEADKLADRIAVLDKGRIIAEGTSDELKSQAGQDRLELVLKKEGDLERAVNVIGGDVQLRKEENVISIPTDGSVHDLRKILDSLDQASIGIDSLSLHKPTLDDVFLRLTGHEAEESKIEE